MLAFIGLFFLILLSSSCQKIQDDLVESNHLTPRPKGNGLTEKSNAFEDNVIVQTSYGKLRGETSTARNGRKYYSFRGIPYAEPPIGPLRFKPPVKHKGWDGIRGSLKIGARSLQIRISTGKAAGDEDCLYLNVYSPQLIGALKPVIVYFHPGAFQYNQGGVYGAKYLLADHDVVLVTVNFRLGIFGFLNLDLEGAAGNMGLKDQAQVLQWVKEEIHNFGGDPSNVTISGTSAGGASVTYHMVSPYSKGLFHKAIAQSGTLLCEWAFMRHHYERSSSVGKFLGFNGTTKQELLDFLMTTPAEKLIQVQDSVIPVESRIKGYGWVFVPSIETVGENRFLSSDPYELIANGQFADVPFITGVTSHEGFFWLLEYSMRPFNFDSLPANLSGAFEDIQFPYSLTNQQISTLTDRVRRRYFNGGAVEYPRDIEKLVNFYGDILFNVPAIALLKSLTGKPRDNPIYFYVFSFDAPDEGFKQLLIRKKLLRSNQQGAAHGAEVSYLLDTSYNNETYHMIEQGSLTDRTITRMTKMWSNFAKTGNPSGEVEWKPAFSSEHEGIYYLNISDEISMELFQESNLTTTFKELFTTLESER